MNGCLTSCVRKLVARAALRPKGGKKFVSLAISEAHAGSDVQGGHLGDR